MKQFRVGILGIGGVGGYFGGKLAVAYLHAADVQIIFMARGENKKAIPGKGIQIITSDEQLTAYPSIVSDDPQEIGKLHLLICCTKTCNWKKP